MTVTINLPQHAEQALIAAAQAKGVSIDVLVRDVLLSTIPAAQPTQEAQSASKWVEEDGIPVLHTGRPISPEIVDDTLNQVRREREFANLGQF